MAVVSGEVLDVGVEEAESVFECEEDLLGVVVDAAQGADLHLEELAELGLDLLLRAWMQTIEEMLHVKSVAIIPYWRGRRNTSGGPPRSPRRIWNSSFFALFALVNCLFSVMCRAFRG